VEWSIESVMLYSNPELLKGQIDLERYNWNEFDEFGLGTKMIAFAQVCIAVVYYYKSDSRSQQETWKTWRSIAYPVARSIEVVDKAENRPNWEQGEQG
jgi:hypothetical protein